MTTRRDFYEILGIAKTASQDEIKAAYRKKALEFHPDRNKSAGAEAQFKEVNEAYQVLSDTQKRKAYDQFGHSAFDPASGMGSNPFAGGFQQGPFTYTYTSSGGNPFAGFGGTGDFNDPFEVFEAFFGGNPFSRAQRKPRYGLEISFREAVKGVEKTVQIDGKTHKIKIPAGADDGTRIRFKEFDITLNVKADDVFKRDGYDLFVDKEITFTLAALGGEIEAPTLDDPIKLKIRPGTQPNTMIRLRQHGVSTIQGRGKGDLYVRLIVKVPEKLSGDQKKLIENLRKKGL